MTSREVLFCPAVVRHCLIMCSYGIALLNGVKLWWGGALFYLVRMREGNVRPCNVRSCNAMANLSAVLFGSGMV